MVITRSLVSFRGLVLVIAVVSATSCASRPQVELAASAETVVAASPTPSTPTPEASPTTSEGSTSASTTTSPEAEGAADARESTGLLAGGVDISTLTTSPEGDVLVQPTPLALQNRQLATIPLLPAPAGDEFEFDIQPFEGDPADRSTWNELCPVPKADLRYVTVSFWGFDGLHHTGELIVAASEADNVVGVFRRLHAIRFPIEEMRVVTPLDVVARRTGDGNNTASFVCRTVTGGTRFSEHAFGLAIDINPFQNPYHRNEVVIPALAWSYLDRADVRSGMIERGDPMGEEVIAAFADIGWEWGGEWNSLKDYQHFSRDNR